MKIKFLAYQENLLEKAIDKKKPGFMFLITLRTSVRPGNITGGLFWKRKAILLLWRS